MAAPSFALGSIPGLLYPGADLLSTESISRSHADATDNDVVLQENVVTSQGIGPCLIFGLMIAELLLGPSLPAKVSKNMLVYRTGETGFRYSPEQANPKNRLRKIVSDDSEDRNGARTS